MKDNDDQIYSRWCRWLTFREMVAAELLRRGIVNTEAAGLLFADDLDMSFEQEYNPVSMEEWPAMIARDADEYEKDLNV